MKKFLIVPGLPRCATTSFVQVLSQHPDIFLPKIKEPHYFLEDRDNFFMFDKKGNQVPFSKCGFIDSEKEFNLNYKNFTEQKVFIDASTLYAVHHKSVDVIASQKDIEPYFIILKKDPFKRALSHYLYSVSRGEEFRDFETALKDEADGKYPKWLLGGYLAGSDATTCEQKIISTWGKERLISANTDKDEVFTQQFMNSVTTMLGLAQKEFSFDVQSNALAYTENKFFSEIRIFIKKIRQVNPRIIDNKLTRGLFEKFKNAMPVKKDAYDDYLPYAEKYQFYFEKLKNG